MSTKIGGAWENTAEKTGEVFLSLKINEELLPLTLKKDDSIALFINEVTEKTNEKAPQYNVVLSKYVPKEK